MGGACSISTAHRRSKNKNFHHMDGETKKVECVVYEFDYEVSK